MERCTYTPSDLPVFLESVRPLGRPVTALAGIEQKRIDPEDQFHSLLLFHSRLLIRVRDSVKYKLLRRLSFSKAEFSACFELLTGEPGG